MRKKITLLIASLAFLLGSSTVWGQTYPFLYDNSYVNNAFGAGESATISGNDITWPNNLSIETTPDKIVLGGANARNTVVRVYNGDGYGIGWVSVLRIPSSKPATNYDHGCTNTALWEAFSYSSGYPSSGQLAGYNILYYTSPQQTHEHYWSNATETCPNGTYPNGGERKYQVPLIYSFNSFNQNEFTQTYAWYKGNNSGGTKIAPCELNLFWSEVTGIQTDGTATITVGHHNNKDNPGSYGAHMYKTDVKAIEKPKEVYTSTRDQVPFQHAPVADGTTVYTKDFYKDDNIKLTQFKGNTMTNAGDMLAQRTPISKPGVSSSSDNASTWYIDNYQRPTTVAIDGETNLTTIQLDSVVWAYQVNYVATTEQNYSIYETKYGFTRNSQNCNSGRMFAYAFDAKWDSTSLGGYHRGSTKLDAAVQLINAAKVCVANNVTDKTTAIGSKASVDNNPVSPILPYQETNALIVLPVTDRVTLRTKGNFQANMHHERTLPTVDNVKYTAAAFPDPDENIYLYPKNALTAEHTYNNPHLGSYSNPMIRASITQPATSATTTVFGVYGDYLHTGKMADIHTTANHTATSPFTPTGKDDNPGVIEVGPTTAGKMYYHVYSGGILKNFEGCNPDGNFTMHFGQRFGGTPNIYLDKDADLNILNYGNYGSSSCPSNIYFHYSAIDTIANAFTSPAGSGAFRVQALSDVEIQRDVTLDATSKGNNVYLLSDGGNVVTQKFDFASDYVDNIGQGLLTLWAEDREPSGSNFASCANDLSTNRNSARGNIYLNDAVTITRAGTLVGTETNFIAANNIRTASVNVESSSTVNDSVNIISRKGDIYLGYSLDATVYDPNDDPHSNGHLIYDNNAFTFDIQDADNAGVLNIKAGYDDAVDNGNQYEGGNIYFTSIKATMQPTGTYPSNIMIPFSNEYLCGTGTDNVLHLRAGISMQHYEHAGIIGGVGRNGKDGAWSVYNDYAKKLGNATEPNTPATDSSLIYHANHGDLTVDAGTRGNIIMNTGSSLNFQGNNGNGFFRTRYGDIDMRGETNAQQLEGGLLFLASSDDAKKWITAGGVCGCDEARNNVYLQDFQYTNNGTYNGSIFVGADNNIKLNYGGLTNRATQADPFLSKDYDTRYNWGTPYKGNYHCDLNPTINQARNLILNFNGVDGGFAAVAADRIDVYKQLIYTGGTGAGMSTVPGQGSLQGENVAGYGLFMKTTAAKNSWTFNGLTGTLPKCPFSCVADNCDAAALHNIVRMTFHDDVRIFTNNQKVLLASPVIESFGHMELDVVNATGSKTSLTIMADSLIFHDSMILNETITNKVKFETWSSGLKKPIMKFGYKRTSPPVQEIIYKEDGSPFQCNDCVTHTKGDPNSKIDTMVIMFKNDAALERSEVTVVDHTVITFLTDSFDHITNGPIRNAKMYTDLFKVRNQVEFWRDALRTRDGHFELISEEQMESKDYAGVYTRHLHMEPIGACGRRYSDLWLCDPALDVITSSTFGGYGKIHADVHVEIEAKLAPGYASLGLRGNCYEQKAGTLSMEDLRLDKGSQIHYTIGDVLGFDDEYTDIVDADNITLYGDVFIHVEKRACQNFAPGCYPIIRYNTVIDGVSNLHNLKLATTSIDGYPLTLNTGTPGVVYLCVGDNSYPTILREIHIPQIPGVTLVSPADYGNHYIGSSGHFYFTVKYNSEPPLKVTTNRTVDGVVEELIGTKNANGEYEYVIRKVQQNIVLKFGPDYATDNIEIVDGKAVWSHGNTIYIRVEKEDIASIYSIAGQLVKRIELSEGSISIPMTRGVYVITLKDGSVHKVILK